MNNQVRNSQELVLDRLTIGYRSGKERIEIQKDLHTSLRPGEFTCLLGPNGAGKSTLLRTLAGFLPPLSGSVRIGDEDINEIGKGELSKKVAIVLTERPEVSSMTAAQLVALGRSPYTGFWGRLSDVDERIVRDAMEQTGTVQLADRLVNTLSDGECQKVMVARALAQQTPVILLDEPTAFLDFPSKAETMRMLRKLAHEQGKIVFLSTHDLNAALALADKLFLAARLREGSGEASGVTVGTPRELADNGALARYFRSDCLEFDAKAIAFNVKG